MNKPMLSGFILCIILGFILAGCSPAPIKVGFSAEITGKRGELGVAARDGAMLAVDYINAHNGIQDRPIELIVKDDKGQPTEALRVDQELIREGVVAIIGHTTSEMTAAVFDEINRGNILLISPTTSSSEFTGMDDNFFRVIPDTTYLGGTMGQHIYQTRGIRQLTGVYDLSNQTFTNAFWQATQEVFTRLGGDASQSISFTSGKDDLSLLAEQVAAKQPQAVLIAASGIDAALFTQYLRLKIPDIPVFASSWSYTNELLEKGGRAVEGMELSAVYNPSNPYPKYAAFTRDYETRYQRSPSLGSAHAYEAVLVLAQTLQITGGAPEGLHQAISSIQGFEGVQGPISIDPYGDVRRDVYIIRVENGQFRLINTIPPENFISR